MKCARNDRSSDSIMVVFVLFLSGPHYNIITQMECDSWQTQFQEAEDIVNMLKDQLGKQEKEKAMMQVSQSTLEG